MSLFSTSLLMWILIIHVYSTPLLMMRTTRSDEAPPYLYSILKQFYFINNSSSNTHFFFRFISFFPFHKIPIQWEGNRFHSWRDYLGEYYDLFGKKFKTCIVRIWNTIRLPFGHNNLQFAFHCRWLTIISRLRRNTEMRYSPNSNSTQARNSPHIFQINIVSLLCRRAQRNASSQPRLIFMRKSESDRSTREWIPTTKSVQLTNLSKLSLNSLKFILMTALNNYGISQPNLTKYYTTIFNINNDTMPPWLWLSLALHRTDASSPIVLES